VDANLQPLQREECRDFQPVQGDGWAHHPYSLYKAPDQASRNPEHVTISELDRLTGLLAKLAARGRINGRLKNLWLTEYGYETNDQVSTKPYTPAQQAQFLAWSEYLAWRNPYVRSYAQFLLRDINTQQAIATGPGRRADGSWQSGLYTEDGQPKPAAETFKLSLWSQFTPVRSRRGARIAKTRSSVIWAHLRTAPGPTTVRIEKLAPAQSAWATVAALQTDAHGFLQTSVPFEESARYRLGVQGADGTWTQSSEITPLRVARPAPVKPKRIIRSRDARRAA
jgi:hypothetical protein